MRTLRKNTQRLWYSLQGKQQPIYEKDASGNIIYDTMPDGTQVPRETGELTNGYTYPVEFRANLSASGGQAQDAAYGVDLSAYDAVLYSIKGNLPINELSLIWANNEPRMIDETTPDPESADYVVRRVPPCLNEIVYLLERVQK